MTPIFGRDIVIEEERQKALAKEIDNLRIWGPIVKDSAINNPFSNWSISSRPEHREEKPTDSINNGRLTNNFKYSDKKDESQRSFPAISQLDRRFIR